MEKWLRTWSAVYHNAAGAAPDVTSKLVFPKQPTSRPASYRHPINAHCPGDDLLNLTPIRIHISHNGRQFSKTLVNSKAMGKYDDEFPDDSLDDVSVSSSVTDDPNKEWEYEKIIAEKCDTVLYKDKRGRLKKEQRKVYLVKWKDFDVLESLWIGENNFVDGTEGAKSDWQRTSMRQQRGQEEKFDIERFAREQQLYNEEKSRRYHRREVKRKRLGIVARQLPETDEEDTNDEDESERLSKDALAISADDASSKPHFIDESSDDDEPLPLGVLGKAQTPNVILESGDHDDVGTHDNDGQPLSTTNGTRPSSAQTTAKIGDDEESPSTKLPQSPTTKAFSLTARTDEDFPVSPQKRRKLEENIASSEIQANSTTKPRRIQTEPKPALHRNDEANSDRPKSAVGKQESKKTSSTPPLTRENDMDSGSKRPIKPSESAVSNKSKVTKAGSGADNGQPNGVKGQFVVQILPCAACVS